MNPSQSLPRRRFLQSGAALTSGALGLSTPTRYYAPPLLTEEHENVIGPRAGFSPHVGTLLSMMTWMRSVIVGPVQGMSTEQLDFLLDENANSIGSMLLHLAATERFYQVHTFEGKKWGDWSDEDKKRFGVAMSLGEGARNAIKGNDLNYYLDTLKEVRENTINEFQKRDDKWLLAVDDKWFWGPTNNYCKWFHVCEHESNHNGQIKLIKSRINANKTVRD